MDTIISFIAIIIIFTLGIWAVDGCYKINEEEEKKKEGKNMSKKIYKGYELYKMIAERKIESGTSFIDELGQKWTFDGKQMLWKEHDYNDYEFSITDFELIEDETIDIESIEELDIYEENVSKGNIIDKINELVQAVKQLHKEIKSIKEK